MSALVDVQNLTKRFNRRVGLALGRSSWIQAVDHVSFQINTGTTMGLVGESGCGKTTIGKNTLLLQKPTAGEVFFDSLDLVRMNARELRSMRSRLGIVYQDPHSSLNPRMNIRTILSRPLALHGDYSDLEKLDRIEMMMETVGLQVEHLGRYPHELSGGQEQRIAIARALITNTEFVVLDEPTSALDVSVQAQILKLLKGLQLELGLTYLFISHDLSVVRFMSDTIAVMYLGNLIEKASKNQLFRHPLHPYTQALLSVVPIPDPSMKGRKRHIIAGDVPSPMDPPTGCRFHPRCTQVMHMCMTAKPKLQEAEAGHEVACHLYVDA